MPIAKPFELKADTAYMELPKCEVMRRVATLDPDQLIEQLQVDITEPMTLREFLRRLIITLHLR